MTKYSMLTRSRLIHFMGFYRLPNITPIYSPRCGMAITACCRWALNVTAAIIGKLGFDVLYGDTDSVMFTLAGQSNAAANAFMSDNRYRPIDNNIAVLMKDSHHISVTHLYVNT
jgi:DNA polymerase elongation subunit (family B)